MPLSDFMLREPSADAAASVTVTYLDSSGEQRKVERDFVLTAQAFDGSVVWTPGPVRRVP